IFDSRGVGPEELVQEEEGEMLPTVSRGRTPSHVRSNSNPVFPQYLRRIVKFSLMEREGRENSRNTVGMTSSNHVVHLFTYSFAYSFPYGLFLWLVNCSGNKWISSILSGRCFISAPHLKLCMYTSLVLLFFVVIRIMLMVGSDFLHVELNNGCSYQHTKYHKLDKGEWKEFSELELALDGCSPIFFWSQKLRINGHVMIQPSLLSAVFFWLFLLWLTAWRNYQILVWEGIIVMALEIQFVDIVMYMYTGHLSEGKQRKRKDADIAILNSVFQCLCRFLTNNYLREEAPNSHVVEQRVEWQVQKLCTLYAFDVHCNSFFPMFVMLYVMHYFLSPLLVMMADFTNELSNCGFPSAVLPFLERTTFFLYPIGIVIILSPIWSIENHLIALLCSDSERLQSVKILHEHVFQSTLMISLSLTLHMAYIIMTDGIS
ncbi:hypothetical protein C3L33_20949, partial [Rhododendron williamsianum]